MEPKEHGLGIARSRREDCDAGPDSPAIINDFKSTASEYRRHALCFRRTGSRNRECQQKDVAEDQCDENESLSFHAIPPVLS
jgi:hypothetical protein